MLSVPEIKQLMDFVLDHANQFSDQGFKQVTFAPNIRKSTNMGTYLNTWMGKSAAAGAVQYLLFIEERLPHEQKLVTLGQKTVKAGHSVQVEKVKTCCVPWTLSLCFH